MNTAELITGKVKDFFSKLPEDWQQTGAFSETESPAEGYARSYRATLSRPWKVPGLDLSFDRQEVFVDVPADGKAHSLRIVLGGKVLGLETGFEGRLNEQGLLSLDLRDPLTALPGPLGGKGSNGPALWMSLLPLHTEVGFALELTATERGMILHHVGHIGLKESFGIPGTSISFSDPALRLRAIYNLAKPASRPTYSGSLSGKATAGKDMSLRVDLQAGQIATLRIEGVDDKGLPGPADLLGAIGQKAEGEALAGAIGEIPLIKDLYIDAVSVDFNLKTWKFLSGSLFGHLELSKYKVRFHTSFPNLRLSASLDPDTPVKVAELIQDAFPDTKELPTHLTVSRAEIHLQAKPLSFRMGLTLSELWETQLGPASVTFDRLRFHLDMRKGQPVTGGLSGSLKIGEVDLAVSGERIAEGKTTGWHFQTALATVSPVRLQELLPGLAEMLGLPAPDHVPDLELSGISIDLNTLKKSFRLTARAELKEKIGVFDSTFVGLDLSIDKNNKEKPFSIKFDGLLVIEKTQLEFEADLGHPDWHLRAEWKAGEGESLHLYELIHVVSPETDTSLVSEPVKKALSLSKAGFSYHHKTKSLILEAANEAGVTLKLNLFKADGGSGAVFGLRYEQPKDMPEFGDFLKGKDHGITLRDAWLIFSWLPAGKDKPTVADSGTPWPLPLDKMGSGLLLLADLDLDGDHKGGLANLAKALPDKKAPLSLKGQIDFKEKSLTLGIMLRKDLSFPTQGSHPLTVKDCEIDLTVSPKGFGIAAKGGISFPIGDYLIDSLVTVELNTDHFRITGRAENSKGIPLFGMKNVQLFAVSLLLGISFEPPGVELGLEGEMTFRTGQSQKEYFGIVLMFTEPIPVPEYFAVDISRLSLAELLRNLSGSKVNSRNFISDGLAKIEALSLFYAARNITLPSGTKVKPGLGFQGKFTLLNWSAWLEFKANEEGVDATGQFEKVDVDGFRMTGHSQDVMRQFVKSGKDWEPVSNTNRLVEGAETKLMPVLKGGGALLHFSTLKPPYLQADFDIQIMDVVQFKAGIKLDDQGLDCKVVVHVPNLYDLNLDCEVRHKGTLGTDSGLSLRSKGAFTAGPHVELPFSLTFPFTGHDKVGLFVDGYQDIQTGHGAPFRFIYRFDFKIVGKTIPGLRLTIVDPKLSFESIMQMAMKNFWDNAVVNICKLILPDFMHFICNALQAPRMKAGAMPPTHLNWMDEAYRLTRDDKPMMLQSGAPAARYKKLVESAEAESETEVARMLSLREELAEVQTEVIREGTARLAREIAIMRREIRDLNDASHVLENAVRETWNTHLPRYRELSEEFFLRSNAHYRDGAARAGMQEAQSARDAYTDKIEQAVMRLAVEPVLKKGYTDQEGKYAKVAVAHFYEVVKMEAEARVEREFTMKEKWRMAASPRLEARKPVKPRIIRIEQEEGS